MRNILVILFSLATLLASAQGGRRQLNWVEVVRSNTASTFAGWNSSGDAAVLSSTQVTAQLNTFTTNLKGLVPAPGVGSGRYLKEDGTWGTPSSAVPGGTNGDFQYNDSGTFGGSSAIRNDQIDGLVYGLEVDNRIRLSYAGGIVSDKIVSIASITGTAGGGAWVYSSPFTIPMVIGDNTVNAFRIKLVGHSTDHTQSYFNEQIMLIRRTGGVTTIDYSDFGTAQGNYSDLNVDFQVAGSGVAIIIRMRNSPTTNAVKAGLMIVVFEHTKITI